MPTVAEHFREIPGAGRERTVELLSDGELQLCSVKVYPYWNDLLQSCRDTIAARKNFRFPGTRRACADLMDAVMQRLRKDHHVSAPKCWLPVIRKLRDEDGPVLIQPRDAEVPKRSWISLKPDHSIQISPEGVLRESFSPLHHVRDSDSRLLEDLEPLLIARARQHGVPTGWTDSVLWLDELIAERPDLFDRLKGPRDCLAALAADSESGQVGRT